MTDSGRSRRQGESLSAKKRTTLSKLSERGEDRREDQGLREELALLATAEISETRRRLFTGIAVTAFFVLAWKSYWFAIGREPSDRYLWPLVGPLLALAPTVCLSLSIRNHLLYIWDGFVGLSFGLMSVGICWTYDLGHSDAEVREITLSFTPGAPNPNSPRFATLLNDSLPLSWWSLALPTALIAGLILELARDRVLRRAADAR